MLGLKNLNFKFKIHQLTKTFCHLLSQLPNAPQMSQFIK